MLTCIAVAVAGASAFGLYNDYQKRCEFDDFKKSKSNGDHIVINGTITAKNPICETSVFDFRNETHKELIATQVRTFSKSKHTVYGKTLLYENADKKYYVPTVQTHKHWKEEGTKQNFVPEITVNGIELIFTEKSDIEWDETSIRKVNGNKLNESVLFNGKYRCLLGKKNNDNTCMVKTMANTEDTLMQKVRSDHYGINNGKTALGTLLLAGSFVFIAANSNTKE